MKKRFSRHRMKQLESYQIVLVGYLAVILFGSFLLSLPAAKAGAGRAPWFDALFTSTSAVCVTGLAIHNTATYWSTFGQAVIITLIQIGGMGFVTVSLLIAILSGKKISIMHRRTMQDSIAAPQIGGIVRLTGFIVRTTFVIELAGAVAMYPAFKRVVGPIKGIWYSVFHSISAFCNAGFDLMGIEEPFSSLTDLSSVTSINVTIMLLIIIGGIGFLTWDDIKVHGIHFNRYRLQSKVVLTATSLLILIPAIWLFFVEFGRPEWAGMSMKERVLASFFQSVTPRTAGFNTVDLSNLTQASQLILIGLMLTGGAPGSTAGGMKNTTMAVLLMTLISVFRRRDAVHCFHRRLDSGVVNLAVALGLLYIGLPTFSGIIISVIEGLPILACIFETSSAIATVGLTLGITTQLSTVSRFILIMLMYIGRIGGLTLIFATVSGIHSKSSRLPLDKISVG